MEQQLPSSNEKIVIIEGWIADHETPLSKQQIEITNGIITRVGQNLGTPTYSFNQDHIIFPVFVDVHIHAREDPTATQHHKETYTTVQAAALNGGVGAVMAMPNTKQPLTTDTLLAWHKERTATLHITIINYAGIGKETSPLQANIAYKLYCGPSVGDIFFENEAQIRAVLQHYRGLAVSFHVEDNDILQASKNAKTHAERRPVHCVNTCLKYVLKMIEDYELEAKLCHWSTSGESFKLIREHREHYNGPRTLLEVSPLNLYFDTDTLEEHPELWPYIQMNPSIRSRRHRLELIKALRTGFIDMVATDHAPHALPEKLKNFIPPEGRTHEEQYDHLKTNNLLECQRLAKMNGTSGTPQLDTYGAICTWLMAEHEFTPQDIARVSSYNPGIFANKFHDGPGKFGKIAEGYYGSLAVLAPTVPTIIEREKLGTKVRWSPFERRIIGRDLPGSVAATIIKGVLHR